MLELIIGIVLIVLGTLGVLHKAAIEVWVSIFLLVAGLLLVLSHMGVLS